MAYADLKQEPYHEPYFQHMLNLHPDLKRVYKEYSGICHHCMFNKDKIRDLFLLIEQKHDKEFWQALLDCINEDTSLANNICAISEYEIYFNFMLSFHKEDCKIRELKWKNVYYAPNIFLNLSFFRKYDFVSKFVRGNRPKYLFSRIRHYIPFRKKIKNFLKSLV